jgi:hypothetical protein
MNWQNANISSDGSHHEIDGQPLYERRFSEVLKFHEPGLAPVRLGDDAWHIHPDGGAAYEPRFHRTFGFYEGRAAVIADAGSHHILTDGADLYAARHAWCGNFQDGRCTVRQQNGEYLHISLDGTAAYDQRWRYAGDFRDGLAVVQADDGHSTHIDRDGVPVHHRWFLDLDVFHKGYARARDDSGWTHIDLDGCPQYQRRFAAVEPFYNGQARVERFDGGLEVIDEAGKCIVELRPCQRSEFSALSADLVGYWKTQAIYSAVELRIPDALPGTADLVAQRCQLIPERALRLLRALAELKLVECTSGIWTCTPRGSYLQTHNPLTLADAAIEYGKHLSPMWNGLPDALRCGNHWQAPDIFKDVAGDELRISSHHRMLQSYAMHDYSSIPKALQLENTRRLIDAGGGTGVLAKMLVERNQDLQVILFDLPQVVDRARQMLAAVDRIEFQGGDLFKPWKVQADAVLLSRVLHDWDDEAALQILCNARSAVPAGGRLFIVEMLLTEDGMSGSLCDLHLLMATGGQERTLMAYQNLMAQAGFAFQHVHRLPALPSVIVGSAV